MNEDDKLVIDAMARMGELAERGESDRALIAELVRALNRVIYNPSQIDTKEWVGIYKLIACAEKEMPK